MSVILANKLRPRKLSDLIGQPTVVTTLTNAAKNNCLHHAYLLCGSYGCGKSTVGKVLSAMVNCVNGPTPDPCGKCDHCIRIFENRHPDVLVIDAASGGKIEEIRNMRANAFYSPVSGANKKIFVIEEAHSLSSAGEEALLLILEEPPPHVMFIMTTTELYSMKKTILSRCQVHRFNKVYWTVMFEHLKNVSKIENIDIEEDALRICTKVSGGSVRSALQSLDTLVSFAGGSKIDAKMAENVLATVDTDVYCKLVNCIITESGKPNATEGYRIINKLVCSGVDAKMILGEIEEYFRCLLVVLTNKEAVELLQYSDSIKKNLIEQKTRFSIANVLKILSMFSGFHKSLEYGIGVESVLDQLLIKSIITCHQK